MANRFVVDLGQVELSKRDVEQIEASIQKATLNILAEADFRGDLAVRFPREWLGIWIDRGLGEINDKVIVEFAGQR